MKLVGRDCSITLSSPKEIHRMIQWFSGSMVGRGALASMDSSTSTVSFQSFHLGFVWMRGFEMKGLVVGFYKTVGIVKMCFVKIQYK